jgi:cell division protein YceG involved in septum cleavage
VPDGRPDDPFVDPADPEAIARERRRQEREARRREREAREAVKEESEAAPPPEPAPAPAPPRTQEEEFWEEPPAQQETVPASSTAAAAPPGRSGGRGGRRLAIAAVLVAMGVAALAIAALAQRYFDDEPAAPAPVVYRTITVTIPEGLSRAQTAELAREEGLRGDYLKASKGKEGYLFPDTYELEKNAPVADLVRLQLETFERRMQGVDLSYARSKNLTLHDVVTIASMVEREAMLDSERKLVAAVIYNRLSDGMPLGIDATIRFATGNYTQPLTESELAVDSPYNTRLNTGLPPGPIGSPGLASLEAAAKPAKVDYLFYVVKPGTCGEHAFSSDEVQFQADVARYNEAREAAGGQSPDSC